MRPLRHPAFLTLAFAPGECAQVDWGCAGSIDVGGTRRRLSFFVMVLAYVRKPNEKGRVENGVGYVKKNFLAGLELPPGLAASGWTRLPICDSTVKPIKCQWKPLWRKRNASSRCRCCRLKRE